KTALRRGIFQLEQAPHVPISPVGLSSLRRPQSHRRELPGGKGFSRGALKQGKRRVCSEYIRFGAPLFPLLSRALVFPLGLVSSTGKFPDQSRQLPSRPPRSWADS